MWQGSGSKQLRHCALQIALLLGKKEGGRAVHDECQGAAGGVVKIKVLPKGHGSLAPNYVSEAY
jgi:hypothetical protein